MESLESDRPRPRQARYQAALRPDRLCKLIIRDFLTEMFSHGLWKPFLANSCPTNRDVCSGFALTLFLS